MHRLAALLLSFLLALVAAWAAPSPAYKPDRTRWLGMAGWGQPACEGAGCTRHRDRLAVSMPPPSPGRARGFSLVRDADGDFVLAIRLELHLREGGTEGYYRAGITLSAATTSVELGLSAHGASFFGISEAGGGRHQGRSSSTAETPNHFRLTRRAGTLLAEYSYDGEQWEGFDDAATGIALPRRVKVGVFAAVTASDAGTFEAVFNELSLTPLK